MDSEKKDVINESDSDSGDIVYVSDNKIEARPEKSADDKNIVKKEKKSRKKRLAKTSRSGKKKPHDKKADDKTTSKILIAIMMVGFCLLIVAVVGIASTASQMKKSNNQTVDTGAPNVQNAENQQNNLNQYVQTTTLPADIPVNSGSDASADGSAAVPSVPQSDEQWLSFFNTAVNKLKTDGPSFTKAKQTVTSDIQLSNSLAQAYVSAVKDKFLSDETVTTEIAKGDKASAVKNVSPDGAAYVSSLSMSDVKSVSHTSDSNGNYVIRIDMKDAESPEKSDAYGKIFEFMLVDDVMNTYAPDIGATVDRANVSLQYSGCYASAVISKDGKLLSYETRVNAHMILKDAKIKVVTTDLDATLASNTTYTDIVW